MADQDWIGLMILKKFADQDWIGFNFIGQDWTRTETFHSPLISDSYIFSVANAKKNNQIEIDLSNILFYL